MTTFENVKAGTGSFIGNVLFGLALGIGLGLAGWLAKIIQDALAHVR